MISLQKVGLYGFGGMGDMFKWYCLQGAQKGWEYLQPLKEKYPEIRTMALICSTNPHAIDLFTHDPYIDTVEYYPWPINKNGNLLQPGQLHLANVLNKRGYPLMKISNMQHLGLEPKKCIVHLSETDNKELAQATKEIEPYVVMHPFASVTERQVIDLKQYNQLIDSLIQEVGYNVVILGKSYQRSFSSQEGLTSYNKEETIQVVNSRVFNLVNQTNARVAIKIVQKAAGFIGVHSCFSCIAAATKIPVVVLSNSERHEITQQTMQNWWTKEHNFSIINVDIQSWSETINKSCSYLRGYL